MYKVLTIDLDWLQSHFHLKKLNDLFFNKIKDAKKIVFSKHHHMVVSELINQNNIILHNIDHHHDICYKDWQVGDIKRGRVTHGCWVGNLLFERKLLKYYWYKNFNSNTLSIDNFGGNLMMDVDLPFYIEEELYEAEYVNDFDLIFVCSSPEYMIKEYSTVYDTYKDICNDKYKSKTKETRLTPDLPDYPIWIKK